MYANIFYNFHRNEIHLWEYDKEGKRQHIIEPYQPYCYLHSPDGEYKDIFGNRCKRKEFDTWMSQREFVKSYATFEGDISPDSRFLLDRYYDKDLISNLPALDVHIVDIETDSTHGFSSPKIAGNEITLITVYSTKTGNWITFGTAPYTGVLKSEFVHCVDEREMLQRYLKWHRSNCPDIITGWNSNWYDVPIILRRIERHLGEGAMKKFSPVNDVQFREFMGEEQIEIAGITLLDYMDLYKKYSLNERESYSLDYISKVELDKTKVKFDGSLDDLRRNDFNKFVEYNIQDVLLVKKLHDKLDFIGLWQVQAYFSKTPLGKVGSAIRKFDGYLMSLLKSQKIVLPTAGHKQKEEIVGAYVSEPRAGYYDFVVSFDFTSLYPHIMFALNMSPETFVGKIQSEIGNDYLDIDLQRINASEMYRLAGNLISGQELADKIRNEKLLISANGLLFKPEFGFIPKAVKGIFDKRKEFKDIKLKEEKLYEETKDPKHKMNAQKYDLFQNAVKILANSAYGILANENFRFFNPDMASAVTLTGQKLIKFTIDETNSLFKRNFNADDAVIAADTDSLYIDFGGFCTKYSITKERFPDAVTAVYEKMLKPFFLNIHNQFSNIYINNEKNWFHLKQEATSIASIFVMKKKYALYIIANEGVVYAKPKLKVKGIEMVRSSTPSFCRKKIEEVVENMLKSMNRDAIQAEVREIREEFAKQPIGTIAFPRGCNFSDYKSDNGEIKAGTPIQVRAAFNYNNMLHRLGLEAKYPLIRDGEKIKFIYVRRSPNLQDKVMAFLDDMPVEFGLDEFIDIETQFEKSFMSPINGLCQAVGWGIMDLDVDSLDSLF